MSRTLTRDLRQARRAVTNVAPPESAPSAAAPAAALPKPHDVLVTRPERAAQRLCTLLLEEGHQPLVEPMLSITAEHDAPPVLDAVAGVIFSSPNAVALTPYNDLPSGWRAWPCYCVGARTAWVAEKYGWQNIIAGDGGGAHLAQIIGGRLKKPGERLLHIGGADLMPEPDASLRSAGHLVLNWTVYRARAVEQLSSDCRAALEQSLQTVLFFSARTAQTFTALVRQDGLESCCARLTALCLSEPIAAAAAALPWRKIMVAAAPHEEALLDVLAAEAGQENKESA